jgi:hypothetical protein
MGLSGAEIAVARSSAGAFSAYIILYFLGLKPGFLRHGI